jgi:decaprenylphospho-beta-D-ribofuranose 2-oxidase
MPTWASREFTGWGRVLRASSEAARPERQSQVPALFTSRQGEALIPFGAGRSYGDAALNGGGRVILSERLDRMLDLDEESCSLTVEAGVPMGHAVDVLLRRGFMLPVVPGTGFATFGGGLANDVHGKNHHRVGSFGEHVLWFDLCLPSGEWQRVSRASDPELFAATVGGLGLTGFVGRICLRVDRVASNAMQVKKRRIQNLDEFLAAFEIEQARSSYVVGWIDALSSGRRLGRGILETAEPSAQGVPMLAARTARVPLDFPGWVLNPFSVRAFNEAYFRRVPKAGVDQLLPVRQFLFPLDAIHQWNRIYGKRGFHQFQCVVPFESGRPALVSLLESIARNGRGSFLAVLKSMGPAGQGMLSFPMPGLTLALDFPNNAGAPDFVRSLEDLVLRHGGRTYLAKDSTLDAARFTQMYSRRQEFLDLLQRIDPGGVMRSDLAVRVGLRPRT